MPIYEYQCQTCGRDFEKMVRFIEADHTQPCPTCQSLETRKKISAFAALGGGAVSSGAGSSAGCGSGGGFT